MENSLHILLTGDEGIVRTTLKDYLCNLGHQVEVERQKLQNRPSLHGQCGSPVQHKEMVQLVNRECLSTFTTPNPNELHSALTFANDPTARVWSVHRLNLLLAVGGWRFLPWDSQVLDYPSASVGGLWAAGDYAEQCHRLENCSESVYCRRRKTGRSLSVDTPP